MRVHSLSTSCHCIIYEMCNMKQQFLIAKGVDVHSRIISLEFLAKTLKPSMDFLLFDFTSHLNNLIAF